MNRLTEISILVNSLYHQRLCGVGKSVFSKVVFCILFLIFSLESTAEGTKELAPSSTDVTMLYTIESEYGEFAKYGGVETGRLFIHIDDPDNEQVFLGFSRQASVANTDDGALINTPYYFRIKDPYGNIVFGPQLIDNTTANADSWALATAGPSPVVGGSGYTPFTFDPSGLSAGDYYIEFSESSSSPTTDALAIKYWDITVATTAPSPVAINGRIWSKRWSLRTPSISHGADPVYTYYDRPFNGQVFLYTEDGFVSKVDFNNSGFRGLSFNLAYNEYGALNTGDFEADRRSVPTSNNTFPQFKIFVNDPDINVYSSGTIGSIITSPVVISCSPTDLCISYAVSEVGNTFILLDFDDASGPGLYDANTADVLLFQKISPESGELAPYERCIPWDGNDGYGNPVSLTDSIPIYFNYAQGLVHFPVYDVEYNVTGFNVYQIRPTIVGFVQKVFYDDTNILFSPGTGQPNAELNGCLPPCHNYTNFDYGELNTINTWWFTNQDFEISFQVSTCLLNAFMDLATTNLATPVVIDVLGNDLGDFIDTASVSNAGLLAPASGTISINASTGEITYTPAPGFIGTDAFKYSICDTLGLFCDTALVLVTVSCSDVVGNIISGTVYNDINSNEIINIGELGQPGVTVSLYQDNNSDGLVDGGDTLLDTDDTDGSGNYSFSLSPSFSTSITYDDIPSSGVAINSSTVCSTPITRQFTVTQDIYITDVNIGFNASHAYRGDIQVTLESPSGTVLTIISNSGDPDTNYDIWMDSASGNPIDDNNTDNVASPYYDRTVTPINSLDAFNGESSIGVWTLRICDTYPSLDNGTYNRSRLSITGNVIYNYVMELDTGDLPVGSTMVTDNVETTVFTSANQNDCANNFGFLAEADLSLTKTVDEANPNVGDTVVFTLTVSNAGPNDATNVQVRDQLPTKLTYVSDNSMGSYNVGTGLWAVGTVNNGASAILEITAFVNASGQFSNVAEVTSSDFGDPDSAFDNDDGDQSEDDEDAVSFAVPEANLSIVKTVSAPTAQIGDSFIYTVTVSNAGPDAATNVEVTDLLPSGLTYQSDDSGGNYDPLSGVWAIPTISNSGSVQLEITVSADGGGVFENTAEIKTSLVYDPNSIPGNGDLLEDDLDSVCISIITPLCIGDSYTINAPAGLSNYQWFRNGNMIVGASAQNFIVDTVIYAVDTINYSAEHPINGCIYESQCPAIFLNPGTTVLAASNSPVCEGDDINLSETGGTAIEWSWLGPNGFASNLQNPSISNASNLHEGDYFLTVTDQYGCTKSDTITVVVNFMVNAGTAVANETLCLNGSGLSQINLFDKLSGEDSGGTWTVISGTPGVSFNPLTGSLNPNGLPIDTYIFRYTMNGSPPCPNDSEDYTLEIERCCPPEICLPFTSTRNN